MITSKQLVLRAIEFRQPPRVPVSYCNRDFEDSDTLSIGYAPAPGFVPSQPGMTEWGYVWHSLDMTMGQPNVHPLADGRCIHSYRPPNPYTPGRLAALPGFIAAHGDRFLRFGLGITGFNAATFLRGFDQFLMDLTVDRALAECVLDYVFDFENAIIGQAVTMDIDAVSFGDDWGTQRGLMISPALWRAVFRPRYAAQFERVHRAGKKVWFHTCGNVWAIIGDLIDVGVDVLELLQPDIFGVDRLAQAYGGKVCFCCSVDHQRRAVSGTRDEIFAYARLLSDRLGAFGGGFIGYIEDYASLGMSEQNYQWIRQAFHGLPGRASSEL
jgi:uroporphyrinogen decarboxylase